jgi:hypothetical protein
VAVCGWQTQPSDVERTIAAVARALLSNDDFEIPA